MVETRDIFEKYPLTKRPNWIMRALFDFHDQGLVNETFTHDDELSQSVWLTAAGMREAEHLIESGVIVLNADDLIANSAQVSAVQKVDAIIAKVAPASDRLVTIGHNFDLSQQLINGVEKISEKIAASNILPVDEKSDVRESLGLLQRLVGSSKTMLVGAFRYLVLERLKKAFEKTIEDALSAAIVLILAGLVALILAVL